MKYKFYVKIAMSHFDKVKELFDKVNKNMKDMTGEDVHMDAVSTIGTITATTPEKLPPEELEKIRKALEETTREKLKNPDILVELSK
jgi:diaminopimelate decarboxylase